MSSQFHKEVFPNHLYYEEVAWAIASHLPIAETLVLTGGRTAEQVYSALARTETLWNAISVVFSDERCVPPDAPESNYGMAKRTLLDHVTIESVHRMRGEEKAVMAAYTYDEEIKPIVEQGLDLMLLGMGADGHIGAIFPGSSALVQRSRLCVPVERPDGLTGLTLTPPALQAALRILLLVTGEEKAEAVRRAILGDEPPETCPVRLLTNHHDVTFLLDDAAASRL